MAHERFRALHIPPKVEDERSAVLAGSHDTAIVALGAEDPGSRPVLVGCKHGAGGVVSDADALIVAAAHDPAVESIEEKGANEASMSLRRVQCVVLRRD